MTPETAVAIRIAEKHLAGESIDRRKALALEIVEAIIQHAGTIATHLIDDITRTAGKPGT